jgi:DNA-binding response OmpR family regulator
MERTPRGRVLVIEDDPEFLQIMTLALEVAGYEVVGAADGEVGLEAYRRAPADLVVVDMITPVRDGVETIVALRRTGDPVRILAISGGFATGPEYYLVLAQHLGADDVMAKPFRMADFTRTVARLLETAPRSAPTADLCPERVAATYDLAERLDDAVIIARLLLARAGGAPDA